MIELEGGKQRLLECNTCILNMASSFETDNSEFFQNIFYGLQWLSLESREVNVIFWSPLRMESMTLTSFTLLINRCLVLISKSQLMLTDAKKVNL